METKSFSKLLFISFLFLSISASITAQVGIQTADMSPAAALEINAQSPSIVFGGFLMPIVTEAQQASIAVSTTDQRDDGMMVYVSDPVTGKHCWDIYNANTNLWESITCSGQCPSGSILFEENFDSYADETGIAGNFASGGDYATVTKFSLSSFNASPRNGVPNYPGSLEDDEDYCKVMNGRLEIQDSNGPMRILTESIDISDSSDIMIEVDIDSSTNDIYEYVLSDHGADDFNCSSNSVGNDYIDIFYSVDGGATFTEFPNYLGLGTANHTIVIEDGTAGLGLSSGVVLNFSQTLVGLSASDLIVKLHVQNWAGAEQIYIDTIKVTCL